jgi:glyoxylate reductase
MTHRRLKIGVTRKLPDAVEARLSTLFEATLNPADAPLDRDQLVALARTSDVLAPTLGDTLDAAFFEAAGDRMKLVANFGAGVDHIDVAAANAHGVTVTNTPSVLAEDAADMAMALILAAPRRLVEGVKALENGDFKGWSPTWMLGRRVRGKKLGIIGLGRVGEAIARRARAFGLSIHYHNRKPVHEDVEQELEATYWESLDQMLARMDIISINCPHTPATYHLLSARRLKLLQPHAVVVNTSRGEVVDENALTRMLGAGELAGAGLDVFEHEPEVPPALAACANVLLQPHRGGATVEAFDAVVALAALNLVAHFDGREMPSRIA